MGQDVHINPVTCMQSLFSSFDDFGRTFLFCESSEKKGFFSFHVIQESLFLLIQPPNALITLQLHTIVHDLHNVDRIIR
jgi:hypothetical protein